MNGVHWSMSDQTAKKVTLKLSYKELRLWFVEYLESICELPRNAKEDESVDINIEDLGMDSLEAHMLASVIEDDFSVEFDPEIIMKHKTVNELAKACCSE